MKKETKIKLKEELEKYLGRECKENELITAEKDVNLLVKILLEKVEAIEDKLKI